MFITVIDLDNYANVDVCIIDCSNKIINFWYHIHCVSVCIRSYSVRIREDKDQNNSEYGHFLRSDYSVFGRWMVFWLVSSILIMRWPSHIVSISGRNNLSKQSWQKRDVSLTQRNTFNIVEIFDILNKYLSSTNIDTEVIKYDLFKYCYVCSWETFAVFETWHKVLQVK